MSKGIAWGGFLLLAYQIVAMALLYSSGYLNVVAYYTHPPLYGEIEVRRMPMLFGDSLSLAFLEMRQEEAGTLISEGHVGLAAIMSSYEHDQPFEIKEAKRRALKIAELFIAAGYDATRCEAPGRSTAALLREWGLLDEDAKDFLLRHSQSGDIFSCQ